MNRAVFLDRDGVINRAFVRNGLPYPPAGLSELEILPGVLEALLRLKRNAGFRLIVVTNQPDVARGTQMREMVEAMHQFLSEHLPIDEFRVCYHDDQDQCDCRKPAPGMLLEAARKYDLDLTESFMVGDRWRDIESGRLAGCKTIFINYGYAEKQPAEYTSAAASLAEAADLILSTIKYRKEEETE